MTPPASGPKTDASGTLALRVVAITLTYRREDALPAVADAVLDQSRPPDAYLVIDNGGTARAALGARPGVTVIETGGNLGVSGGYARALREALAAGADLVWAIDDDVVPDPDCLATLLEHRAADGAAIVLARQRREEGSGRWLLWNGGLLDADLVRRLGPPTDYFYWAEDVDYLTRARRAGARIERAPRELVTHRALGRRSRGGARDWRLYYVTRNTLHFRIRVKGAGPSERFRTWWGLAKTAAAIVLLERDKRRSAGLLRAGIRDYRRGVLGRTLDPESWTARYRSAGSPT
jgi:rhamnopyranosyl-N-acetylglucosaminyl-diphospho-decaprenol beta-1,3/1,4-galactofuranosyltransferase